MEKAEIYREYLYYGGACSGCKDWLAENLHHGPKMGTDKPAPEFPAPGLGLRHGLVLRPGFRLRHQMG